jgi:ATP-dependent Clp protease adaptor protein ClpS
VKLSLRSVGPSAASIAAEIGTQEIVVPDTVEELLGRTDARPDRPWVVIVWDDPINLMDYVTFVFQKLFGYSKAKARRLMLQVHNEGKAVVSNGSREHCEGDVARLHAHGLWATMQHDK